MKCVVFTLLVAVIHWSCATPPDVMPDTILGGHLENSVILDGTISNSMEWSDTAFADLELHLNFHSFAPFLRARVWIKNDGTWLYMLYRIERGPKPFHQWNSAQLAWFKGRYVPPWDFSDLANLSVRGEAWDACGWDDREWHSDTDRGGRSDVEGAVTHDGECYWFEFRKKLFTEDGCDVDMYAESQHTVMIGFWDNTIHTGYNRNVTLKIFE